MTNLPHVHVAAAIIKHDNKILAACRGYGDLKGSWEFPGGKLEPGENSEEALKRELFEELHADIIIEKHFDTVNYKYPTFEVTMECYLCQGRNIQLDPEIHTALRWLSKDELFSVPWLPADLPVVKKLEAML